MKTNDIENIVLTKKEVAEAFRVTVRTIDRWMTEGHLPFIRIGKTIRFSAKAIRELTGN